MSNERALLIQRMACGLATLIVLLVPLSARAVEYGDVSVTVEAPPSAATEHGYAEYRATITNRSSRAREVEVSLEEMYGYSAIEKLARTTAVPASSTVTVSLFQPALPLGSGKLAVRIDGREEEQAVSIGGTNHAQNRLNNHYGSRAFQATVLGSREVMAPLIPLVGGSFSLVQNPNDAPQWSGNWLGYTRYTALALSGGDWDRMPEAARTAVRRYVQAGGVLLMLNPGERAYSWQTGSRRQTTPYGFGQVIYGEEGNLTHWPVAISNSLNRESTVWQDLSIEETHAIFPVIEKYGLPARGMLILLVLFALVIGPLNFVVLARKNRRMWLLWTVPAISLATSLAVFLYAALAEGWTTKVRCETVTYLDQRTHDAATFGYLGVYASLTPGDGLHFSYDTEVWPELPSRDYRDRPTPRAIDLSHDQHLESGWVTARVPAYFKVRKAEQRRERLVVEREADGSLWATNGLGAAVTELYLTDKSSRVYHAAGIPAGGRANLTMTPERAGDWQPERLIMLAGQDWRRGVASMMGAAPQLHRPNSYVALLDGAPFMEQPLKGAREIRAASAVFGVLED